MDALLQESLTWATHRGGVETDHVAFHEMSVNGRNPNSCVNEQSEGRSCVQEVTEPGPVLDPYGHLLQDSSFILDIIFEVRTEA